MGGDVPEQPDARLRIEQGAPQQVPQQGAPQQGTPQQVPPGG